MKKVLFIFAMLLAGLTASAQDIALNDDGEYEVKEVVTVDSVSATVLYDRAMIALSDWTGPDGKARAGIDYQNQETHTVVYKGNFYAGNRKWMTTTIDRYANFMVKVRCKDGRAQVTVNVPTLTATVASVGRSQTWNLGEAIAEMEKTSGKRRERGDEAVAYITGTADNIVTAMKAALTGSGDSDDDFYNSTPAGEDKPRVYGLRPLFFLGKPEHHIRPIYEFNKLVEYEKNHIIHSYLPLCSGQYRRPRMDAI